MNFLACLTESLGTAREASPADAPPLNLVELGRRLDGVIRQRRAEDQCVRYVRQWTASVHAVYSQNKRELLQARGQMAELWAEQADIYEDLLEHMAGLGNLLERRKWDSLTALLPSYHALLDELSDSIERMQRWRTSEDLRCLSCGWSDLQDGPVCPHCGVHVMKPIRQLRGDHNNTFLHLAPTQFHFFQTVQQVLSGAADVTELAPGLAVLAEECCEALSQAEQLPQTDPQVAHLNLILAERWQGLCQVQQAMVDFDAQNIEDGWYRLFCTERAMADFLPELDEEAAEPASDTITLSSEDD